MNSIFTTTITLLDPDTYIYIGWGILILLTVLLVLLWRFSKRLWLKVVLTAPLMFLWLVFLYGSYVGVNQFRVRYIELTFDDLPPSFDGYKIVQISDIHCGTLTGSRRHLLEEAIDSINAQDADMGVFTGDLQNRAPREIDPFRKLLSSIKAKDGIFSVMGNHDFPLYMKGDPIMKSDTLCVRENVDEELGWRLLVNDRQFIKRGEEKIYISGMDNDGDGVRFPQNGDIQHALYGLTPKHFVVMLEHDPSAWRRKILPHSHVQLTLSGHTHGGQFSFLGWSPASLKYKEYSGLYSLAGRYLYVSNGLSGVVPFRFGTLPEISVFTLRTSKSSVNK